MTHGSVFSGVGGFDIAAEWMGWENIFNCEINAFGQQVLNRYHPHSQGLHDITTTNFTKYATRIDVLTGGFPCQDASQAKQYGESQQGLSGYRTGLFWDMCRVIREVRPKVAAVFENVENILRTNGGQDFSAILTELSRMGYNAEWRVCRASEVGAPHHRARLYLVAYPNSFRLQEGQTFFSHVQEKASPIRWDPAGTPIQTFRGGAWASEPPALCVVDGISNKLPGFSDSQWRKEQFSAYGNAVIPQLVFKIFKGIEQYKKSILK